jgi:hypothetical protein
MSQTYNISDLFQFINEEDAFLEDLINETEFNEAKEPSPHIINNVLSYSKALSIKKSNYLVDFEMVLN